MCEQKVNLCAPLAGQTLTKEYEIFEEALRSYLGLDLLATIWAQNNLGGDDALKLAYHELHAA